MTKKEQIIFIKGKIEGLKTLFNSSNFGYLAIGYADDTENGFSNPTTETDTNDNGFNEIKKATDGNYSRPALQFVGEYPDYETGRVVCRFTATLSTSNIVENVQINQFAICNSADPTDENTVFYCASTFPVFTKNDNLEISFTIDLGI